MYAPPLSVLEAIRLIAERLALAGHPRTPEDDLAEMGGHWVNAPERMFCNFAVLVGRIPHEIFGGRALPGVYEQAKAELAAAIAVGDITVTNDLVRRSDIDRLWPPTIADAIPIAVADIDRLWPPTVANAIPIAVAASDPASASQKVAASRKKQREMAPAGLS